jgi:hypothetical protein
MSHNSWDQQKQDFEDLCKVWDKAMASGIFAERKSPVENRSDFFGNYDLPDDGGIKTREADYWSDVLSRSGELAPDESMMLMEAARKKAAAKKKKEISKKKSPDSKKKDLDEKGAEEIGKETKKFAAKKSGKGGDRATGDYDISPPYSRVKTSVETDDIPSLVKKVKRLANQPNPVKPDTYGPDSTNQSNTNYVSAGWGGDPKYGAIEKLKHDLQKAEQQMSKLTGLDNKKIKLMEKTLRDLRDKIEKVSSDLVTNYRKSKYYT